MRPGIRDLSRQLDEFTLISRYFDRKHVSRSDVLTGIGDDGAVLSPRAGNDLVLTSDVLVSGIHFPVGTAASAVGHKALAVNLSDLAAMGAEPAWVSLNVTMPRPDEAWLEGFCEGFFALADEHAVQLVGGDTTRGPLTIGVHALGWVPRGGALRRSGARPGDGVYVTGTLGDAALGLMQVQRRLVLEGADATEARRRLDRPRPRVQEGVRLRRVASACIDVSDGLVADVGHVLEASGVGARIELESLPRSTLYRRLQDKGTIDWDPLLTHGDDYELLFTMPTGRRAELARSLTGPGMRCTCIGVIEPDPGLRLIDGDGGEYRPRRGGYDHFTVQGGE